MPSYRLWHLKTQYLSQIVKAFAILSHPTGFELFTCQFKKVSIKTWGQWVKIDGCLPGIFMAKQMPIVWWPLSSASLQWIIGCRQASMKALQAQGVICRGALPSADHRSSVLPPASVNLISSSYRGIYDGGAAAPLPGVASWIFWRIKNELVKINTLFFDHLEWNLYSKIMSVYCHFKLVSLLCFTEESRSKLSRMAQDWLMNCLNQQLFS